MKLYKCDKCDKCGKVYDFDFNDHGFAVRFNNYEEKQKEIKIYTHCNEFNFENIPSHICMDCLIDLLKTIKDK